MFFGSIDLIPPGQFRCLANLGIRIQHQLPRSVAFLCRLLSIFRRLNQLHALRYHALARRYRYHRLIGNFADGRIG